MKKIIVILAIISIFSGSLVLLMPKISQASYLELKNQEGFGGTNEIPKAFGEDERPLDVRYIVANIIKAVLGLLATIFIILIVIAGYKWMMSQGNEEEITKAKDTIKNSIIGLIIILASYGITVFVFGLMTEGTSDWNIFEK